MFDSVIELLLSIIGRLEYEIQADRSTLGAEDTITMLKDVQIVEARRAVNVLTAYEAVKNA